MSDGLIAASARKTFSRWRERAAERRLTDDQESVWRDVVQRVDEVYSDLLRYEADLEGKNAELEEAQSFISSVIASVSDILVVCDEDGVVLQANPAFVTCSDAAEADLIGAPLARLDRRGRPRAGHAHCLVAAGAQARSIANCAF